MAQNLVANHNRMMGAVAVANMSLAAFRQQALQPNSAMKHRSPSTEHARFDTDPKGKEREI